MIESEQPQPQEQEQSQEIFPVKFCPQKGQRYLPLVESGLAENIEVSGFCWLACIDMAISTNQPNDEKRFQIVSEIAHTLKASSLLTEVGGLLYTDNSDKEFLLRINTKLSDSSIPLSLTQMEITSPMDLIRELKENKMLLLGTYQQEFSGHMILMDKIFTDNDHSEQVMGYWNPSAPRADALYAREFVGIHQFTEQGRPARIAPNVFVINRLEAANSKS